MHLLCTLPGYSYAADIFVIQFLLRQKIKDYKIVGSLWSVSRFALLRHLDSCSCNDRLVSFTYSIWLCYAEYRDAKPIYARYAEVMPCELQQ
jgi:hypothetical protein